MPAQPPPRSRSVPASVRGAATPGAAAAAAEVEERAAALVATALAAGTAAAAAAAAAAAEERSLAGGDVADQPEQAPQVREMDSGDLEVEVRIPGVRSARMLELDVSADSVRVSRLVGESTGGAIDVPLPRLVEPSSARARFNRTTAALHVRISPAVADTSGPIADDLTAGIGA